MRHRYHAWPPTLGCAADGNRQTPRVGLAVSRTLEYIDLRGAPWIIQEVGEPDNSASASSVVYKSIRTIKSDSLAEVIKSIDDLKPQRVMFESTALHYPQVGFQDSGGDHWDVEYVTGGMTGYYGLQWGVIVGPATSKTALKSMVEKYLKRLEGGKDVTTKYGTGPVSMEAFVTDADLSKSVEVPPEVFAPEPKSSGLRGVVVIVGAIAIVSYIAYATWMKGI